MSRSPLSIILETSFFIVATFVLLSIMYVLGGEPTALSQYARDDDARFFFKLWVFLLALGAARTEQFKYSAFPLIGLGMFDVRTDILTQYAHDTFAILFFALTTVFLFKKKRSKIFGVLIILGLPMVVVSLYFAELMFVAIIISYLIFICMRLYRVHYGATNK